MYVSQDKSLINVQKEEDICDAGGKELLDSGCLSR